MKNDEISFIGGQMWNGWHSNEGCLKGENMDIWWQVWIFGDKYGYLVASMDI